MGGDVFPPHSLACGQTVVGVIVAMVTSFKRTYASMQWLPELLYSVPLTAIHAPSGDSWTLTDKSGSVSCGGHCSFLLGPALHKILFVPYKSLFPQYYGSSVIKSYWLSKSNSLGVSVPLPSPQFGKSVVCPRTCDSARTYLVSLLSSLWFICSVAL